MAEPSAPSDPRTIAANSRIAQLCCDYSAGPPAEGARASGVGIDAILER